MRSARPPTERQTPRPGLTQRRDTIPAGIAAQAYEPNTERQWRQLPAGTGDGLDRVDGQPCHARDLLVRPALPTSRRDRRLECVLALDVLERGVEQRLRQLVDHGRWRITSRSDVSGPLAPTPLADTAVPTVANADGAQPAADA
jgi:hypothetical protein